MERKYMYKFIILLLLLSFHLLHSEVINEDTTIQQGLIILTNNKNVEVIFEDTSIGIGTRFEMRLPVGKYRIVGKRKDYFVDVEIEHVWENEVSIETLAPRKFRFTFLTSISTFISKNEHNYNIFTGLTVTPGFQFLRHFIGLFGCGTTGIGKGGDLNMLGIQYNYTLLNGRVNKLKGCLSPVVYNMEPYLNDGEISFGVLSTVKNQIGWEHLKFSQSFSFLISNKLLLSFSLGLRILI